LKPFFWILLAVLWVGRAEARQVYEWDTTSLSARGTTRFTELLQSLEPINYWSTDRYTARVVGLGLGGPHALGPAVIVDNLLTTPRLMDRIQYELIPLVSQDIDRIHFKPGLTRTADGRLVDGIVYVETKQPAGFTVSSHIGWTNETGDPGPYLYTNAQAKNVDRSGPTVGARITWGNDRWVVRTGFDTDAFHMTDPRTDGRIWRTYAGQKKALVYHATPNVQISFRGERSRLGIQVARSVKNDFLFDEIASTEWPLKQYRTWSSGFFEQSLSDRVHMGLRLGYTDFKTGNLPAAIDLPNNLRLDETYAESYVSRVGTRFSGEWSVGGRLAHLEQSSVVSNRTEQRLYSRTALNWEVENDAKISVTGSIGSSVYDISDVSRASYSVGATATVPTYEGGIFSLGATVGRDDYAGIWSTWDLLRERVQFDAWAPEVQRASTQPLSQYLDAFLTFSMHVTPHFTLWTDIRARNQSGLTVPLKSFEKEVSDIDFVFYAPTRFAENRSGTILKPSIGATYRAGSHRINVQYEHRRIVSKGDLEFWKYVTGLPPHRLTASFVTTPLERLSLFLLVRVQSQSIWADFAQGGHDILPGFVEIESTVTKMLWSDHLKVGLSFLNMADRSLVRYPAGVNEQFAVRLTVSAFFNDESGRE